MHQQFCASISKLILPAIAVGVLFTGTQTGLLSAQAQESEQKRTTEPVFRVSKLSEIDAGQDLPSQNAPTQEFLNDSNSVSPTNNQRLVEQPIQQPSNMDRIADSSSMPRVTPRGPNTVVPNLPPNIPSPNLPAAKVTTPAVLPSATTRPPVSAVKTTAPHPLDRAVNIAEVSLTDMRNQVRDYTAILSKREQINGVLGEPSYMNIKIRCPRTMPNGTVTPFSVYMKFLRPTDVANREVIWVDGHNESKLSVHEAKGLLRFKTFQLDPTGTLAMRGQKYPIYEAGLENLIIKLIEKAERDRAAGPCKVDYRPGAINKRPCSVIELIHDERRAPYEFHKAQVYIDDELQLPIRFAAYDWPTSPGAKPELLEEYTYYNVKVNVGLTDIDFSTTNPNYKFPNR